MNCIKTLITTFAIIAVPAVVWAQDGVAAAIPAPEDAAVAAADTPAPDSIASQPKARKGLIGKVIDYFDKSNDVDESKRFDISFIGGPHYSNDTGFGLGAVASLHYRPDMTDTVTPRSIVSFAADATTKAHFMLKAEGYHIFRNDKSRLIYDVRFSYLQDKYWGIGYDECSNDANETKYNYMTFEANAAYVFKLGSSMYLGPMVSFDSYMSRDVKRPDLFPYLEENVVRWGPGVSLQFDARDNLTAPKRGAYVRLDFLYMPKFIGNAEGMTVTELTAAGYFGLWRDCTMAVGGHARLTTGLVPFNMMSTVGGSHFMRGYFDGRYRDRNEVDVCVELRQRVWRRSGLVVWGGMGMIFDKFSNIDLGHLLPNYGLGYRWEFKHNVNIRLDVGFGRNGERNFIFSINEAF
ncbi:MAG: BamA/TamA family outer membrane protein [Muribaculaceae bacterium]